MKTVIFFLTLIYLINLQAQENHIKIYPFKSAVIEYKYEASFSGRHIKYIDDYGYKQADYISKTENFGGNSDKHYETIILIGEKAYTINPEDSTVAVGRNENYGYYLRNSGRSCTEISRALLQAEGGWRLKGHTNYLDKECEVWKSGKSKKTIWQGLMLESEVNFMTMMVEKAVSIELDTNIPADKFEIPRGLRYLSTDVYQGFAGLKLSFDKMAGEDKKSANHIKIEFSSEQLSGCNNFADYSVKGKKVILRGDNGYNKIDNLIIKSQRPFMKNKSAELHSGEILIFMTADKKFGKMQIKKIDKKGCQVRYALYNNSGALADYSEGSEKTLINGIIITKKDKSLTITSKNKTIYSILNY